MRSISMMTEVSTRPRGYRRSATRGRVLVEDRVDLRTEPIRFNLRGAGERRERDTCADKLPGPDGCQLSNRHAIARDQKGLATIEAAHDLATGVPELALGDRTGHRSSVAHVLRSLIE